MKKFSSFSDNVKLVKPSRAQSTWRLWKSLPGFIRLGSERIPTQDIFGMEDERSFALEFDRREGILAHTLTSNPDKKCNFNFQFCHQSSFYFNINLFIAFTLTDSYRFLSKVLCILDIMYYFLKFILRKRFEVEKMIFYNFKPLHLLTQKS